MPELKVLRKQRRVKAMPLLPDENHWPLVGRSDELRTCIRFLAPGEAEATCRLLKIEGESGIGKTFLVKELICRFTEEAPNSIALYVDVDESEFESADLSRRLALLASQPSRSSRKDPQHVPPDADLVRFSRPLPRWIEALRQLYVALREAVALVPLAGKVLKAILPEHAPISRRRELATSGRVWEYLVEMARRRPVIVAIDNIQFLPKSTMIELDTALCASEKGFRLVTIERVKTGHSKTSDLRCFVPNHKAIHLRPIGRDDVQRLVTFVVGSEVDDRFGLSDLLFRKSLGVPKQLWLQLRSLKIMRGQPSSEAVVSDYEETIVGLPGLDRLALQVVTLLIGGLRIDDVAGLLESVASPIAREEINKTISDLSVMGLLIVNGMHQDRVRTEHELVRISVRHATTEEEALSLRARVMSALSARLDDSFNDSEYERLADRLIGLATPEDLRRRHDLLGHLITLIDRQTRKENFHYLSALFGFPACIGVLNKLPGHCLGAFLDAFQKVSQFDKGLAAIELMRDGQLAPRRLALFGARYLIQKFDYQAAGELLTAISGGTDRDLLELNILANLRRDREARAVVDRQLSKTNLDEYQCVILRNCAHLYDLPTARARLSLAVEGFRRLRLRFGEATTINNRGVIELWAGNRTEARRFFVMARSRLSSLGSNEIYQPLTNLSVVEALDYRFSEARRLLDEAQAAVSPQLAMDHLMLRVNHLSIDLMEERVSILEAAQRLSELYHRSLETRDVRFQEVLGWYWHQVESLFGESSVAIGDDFDSTIRSSARCGMEVFLLHDTEAAKIPIVFQLSPHWRY